MSSFLEPAGVYLPGTVITPRKSDGLARADEAAAERNEFVSEGQIKIGPSERFFVFWDGEYLGQAPFGHVGLPVERGCTDLGRVRVTAERLG